MNEWDYYKDGQRQRGYLKTKKRKRDILSPYFKKIFSWGHMDFEYALWQMFYLVISPKRVYRNIYYHKQTKNQWSRDDPAFVILQLVALLIISAGYGAVYGAGFRGLLLITFKLIIFNYFILGFFISLATWLFSNNFLLHQNVHVLEQRVELQYAFDVHCNSFFPAFLILYVVQFFFLPVLMKPSWISLFLGNTLYAVAAIEYIYITYLGFQALPFLQRQTAFLSEYWVSTPKHWCIYCKIYIADNKSSKDIHNSGTRHKVNVQKYLQDVDRQTREKEKEDSKLNSVLSQIEAAANESIKRDISEGHTNSATLDVLKSQKQGSVAKTSHAGRHATPQSVNVSKNLGKKRKLDEGERPFDYTTPHYNTVTDNNVMGGCNIPTLDTNVNAPVLPEWVKKENEKLDSTGIGAWVAVVSENKQVNTTTEDITTKRSSSPERSIANKKNAQPPPSDVTKDQSTKLPHFKLTQKVIKDNGTKMDRLPLKSDTKEAEGLSLPVFKKKKKPSNIRS